MMDDMDEEMLNEIHKSAVLDDSKFVVKENDEFKNQHLFKNATEKDFGDGIVIRYTGTGNYSHIDPLGIYTHILIIKEV